MRTLLGGQRWGGGVIRSPLQQEGEQFIAPSSGRDRLFLATGQTLTFANLSNALHSIKREGRLTSDLNQNLTHISRSHLIICPLRQRVNLSYLNGSL